MDGAQDTISLSSDSSLGPYQELLRTQHALCSAFQAITALRGHLEQVPPPLRQVRGHHVAQWLDLLAQSIEESAQQATQAGELDVSVFVPPVADRLRDLQGRLALLPTDATIDFLVYAAYAVRCSADSVGLELD